MITRLLIANRGEIARRIIRTCRRLGIETVAVHSPADAGLPFVREADWAVALPGNAPAESYLDVDALIAAARSTGADAVHPGYGFLAENADFARAVIGAGLTWVGPSPESIAAMGSKIGAKELMRGAGVPVLEAPRTPTEADLPLLVKASAGGGGRGMRVVRRLADLEGEIAAASAEAAAAFGDGTVFVEPYVEAGRHVEVQVVADEFGFVEVFGDRDCSVQRRHQKIVEEAPAPGLSVGTRAALHAAARAATLAVDYVGAGTVEFLLDPARDRFFFLEMNTRLQVEHPVTEAVFGVDLVELQLAMAEHEKLPAVWATTPAAGHAIEARLYAEDPAADHAPQSGRLVTLEIPDADGEFALDRPGIRVDAGYASGSEVSTHYDAMLAKVVAWAPTREQAIRRLAGALRRARIHGVTSNRDQLLAVLDDPAFVAGRMSTALLPSIPVPAPTADPVVLLAAAGAAVAERASGRRVQHAVPVGWRNVRSDWHRLTLDVAGEEHEMRWWGWPEMECEGLGLVRAAVRTDRGWRVRVEHDGVQARVDVPLETADGSGTLTLHVQTPDRYVRVQAPARFSDPAAQHATGSLLAPMPGTVVAVPVETGASVGPGDPVVVLEAMKMQHTVTAPHAGTVTTISVAPGRQVAAGDVLAVVEDLSGEEAS